MASYFQYSTPFPSNIELITCIMYMLLISSKLKCLYKIECGRKCDEAYLGKDWLDFPALFWLKDGSRNCRPKSFFFPAKNTNITSDVMQPKSWQNKA